MDSVHLAHSQVEFPVESATAPFECVVQFTQVYVTWFMRTFKCLSVRGFSNMTGVAAVDRFFVFLRMLGQWFVACGTWHVEEDER